MARYGNKASEKVEKARAQEGHTEKWTLRKEGQEPETSDCYWPFTGSEGGRQGTAEKVLEEMNPLCLYRPCSVLSGRQLPTL